MWPLGMTRQELEAFLREYWDEFLEILLTAYGLTVSEIVTGHLSEEAADWLGEEAWR